MKIQGLRCKMEAGSTSETGKITGSTTGGALFTILHHSSRKENKGAHEEQCKPYVLLLVAHGFRVGDELNGDLSVSSVRSGYVKRLLEDDSFVVGFTSYRRNGWIITHAIEDLHLLREQIISHFGHPTRSLLMGDSMGGQIVTRICENTDSVFDGAVAVGAAGLSRSSTQFRTGDSSDQSLAPLTYRPVRPILYLTNASEIEGPREYVVAAAVESYPAPNAVLWPVRRTGHCNVNSKERHTAILALLTWINEGKIERARECTLEPIPEGYASSVRFSQDGDTPVGNAHVHDVDAHGNIMTDVIKRDLDRLGIDIGSSFLVRHDIHEARVRLGRDYGDGEGNWVGFIHAEGFLFLSKNYENGAAALNVQARDSITLHAP